MCLASARATARSGGHVPRVWSGQAATGRNTASRSGHGREKRTPYGALNTADVAFLGLRKMRSRGRTVSIFRLYLVYHIRLKLKRYWIHTLFYFRITSSEELRRPWLVIFLAVVDLHKVYHTCDQNSDQAFHYQKRNYRIMVHLTHYHIIIPVISNWTEAKQPTNAKTLENMSLVYTEARNKWIEIKFHHPNTRLITSLKIPVLSTNQKFN